MRAAPHYHSATTLGTILTKAPRVVTDPPEAERDCTVWNENTVRECAQPLKNRVRVRVRVIVLDAPCEVTDPPEAERNCTVFFSASSFDVGEDVAVSEATSSTRKKVFQSRRVSASENSFLK